MAAASFMSPMPMPFVAAAAARNTVKKKAEQARLTEIFDGAVKMSFRISSEKNPNVIEFGIRRSRKSKNEMVARYKRQVCLVSICSRCSFIFASLGGIIFFMAMRLFNKGTSRIPFAPFAAAGYLLSELVRGEAA